MLEGVCDDNIRRQDFSTENILPRLSFDKFFFI